MDPYPSGGVNGDAAQKDGDAIELRHTSKTNDISSVPRADTKVSSTDCQDVSKSKSVSYNVEESREKTRSPDSIDAMNREKFDTPVLEDRPPSYMWLAICTTIFSNPFMGVIAIIIAFQADNEYIQGNIQKARWLGQIVKILCIISIVVTFSLITVLAIFLNIDFTRV